MESSSIKVERRGRKRKKRDNENVSKNGHRQVGRPKSSRVVPKRSTKFVGRYLIKEFEGNGIFLGKIVYYDGGLYRVDYEDGDCEDLESGEIRKYLVEDDHWDKGLLATKEKLDKLVSKKEYGNEKIEKNKKNEDVVEVGISSEVNCGSEVVSGNDGIGEADGNVDSSSDSCEFQERELGMEEETVLGPPPELPPSSGSIGVQEEYVSHLFSTYGFLRSFSIRLFLSPFGLDDFVGSLNCHVPNTLMDAVHVALLRQLSRHLETQSSEGSELAAKCLRCVDWSLLDVFTWPVYMVQYLIVMGYTKGLDLKGFTADIMNNEYYTLSAGMKLMLLQILCDDVLDSAEIREEIDMREESEVGESDSIGNHPSESAPRRVHPRYSKTTACRSREALDIVAGNHETKLHSNTNSLACKGTDIDADAGSVDLDENSDECRICGMDGTLLCCDGCPSAYHSRCIGVCKMFIPEGAWYCPECAVSNMGLTITKKTSLRGAEIFGIDPYNQVFLGTCDHLLVLNASSKPEPYLRYYKQNDIQEVLQAIHSSAQHINLYSEIFTAILQHWKIPENALSLPERVENSVNMNNDDKLVPASPLSIQPPEISGSMTQAGLPAVQTNEGTARGQIKMEPSMSAFPVSQAENSDLNHQEFSGRSSVADFTTCTSLSIDSSNIRHLNGACLPKNISSQSREVYHEVGGRGVKTSADEWVYTGSNFRPNAYINQYAHGEFAASAAANLAVVSSEENKISEAQMADNPRKAMSANILLQVKAFSSAATRFFWPNPEKKLVEVPRERCGWCLACRAPAASKKACLLNAVCLNAMRASMKILSGLRPNKNGEGSLPSIATYILFMKESLNGLMVGPFLSASYRRHWHKQVEQALTCNELKYLLLELEENLRMVALSTDWVKLVDNWVTESSVVQAATCVATTQKRGRRKRRPSAMSEADDGDSDGSNEFTWWRGGKLSKLIFQKGILPRSIVKRAARQGGARKIPGISYTEDIEIPRRSRQFAWRAAVEMCNNASQLALQVRYLDVHVRWSDLNRPEQSPQDGKGQETEASAFRNALICDKKVVENKIMYGVTFGNQKHLPSRVMKSIIEVEQSQDGKDKYWFLEMRVPLYLIKEYEARSEDVFLPSSRRDSNVLSPLQRRQLKASRRDIFSYLTCKRDELDKCSCASCQLDVRLRDSVKCSECQGYCHQSCTVSSIVCVDGDVEFLATCKQCYDVKFPIQKENDSPTSPLPLGGQECNNGVNATKGAKAKGYNQSFTPTVAIKNCSETKTAPDHSTVKKNRSKMSWGLIWKKKDSDETGIDFRLRNIVLKGNPCMEFTKPICLLCSKPYNSDLTYIRCETCKYWYHGEAVELEECKIPVLKGFKCCKCRRIRSPICPYMDPESKKAEGKKSRLRSSKRGQSEADYSTGTPEQYREQEPTTPLIPMTEDIFMENEDPLLFSLSRVEQVAEPDSGIAVEWNTASGTGPQKLPVRRHVKREGNAEADGFCGSISLQFDSSQTGTDSLLNPSEDTYVSQNVWDVSNDTFDDGLMFDYEDFNYEDMEFEPQTYFSFTELLSSEHDGEMDVINASVDGVSGHNETSNCDQQEATFSEQKDVILVQCQMCSCTEPVPDLSCQSCGLWIHRHCSPWTEPSSEDNGWKCSNCREWQ